MKKHVFIISAALLIGACQNEAPQTLQEKNGFNAELAQSLGADAYGMRQYVFATLLTGPNDALITDAEEREILFAGHFTNMGKLAEEGKLVLAGPFMDAPPKRGLFILNVETIEEAQTLVQTDPSIAAGIFKVEFAKYYGSAALMQVNEVHKTLQETKM